jgi:hypothetical protein
MDLNLESFVTLGDSSRSVEAFRTSYDPFRGIRGIVHDAVGGEVVVCSVFLNGRWRDRTADLLRVRRDGTIAPGCA